MGFDFAAVLVFAIVAVGFALGGITLSRLVGPRIPNAEKATIYECGERPVGVAWFNFNPRFYLVALVFVIFEVDIALTFPVVAVYREWTMASPGVRLGRLRRALPLHRHPRGRAGLGVGARRPRVGEEPDRRAAPGAGPRRSGAGPRERRAWQRSFTEVRTHMAAPQKMDSGVGGDVTLFHTTQLDKLINMARENSLWYLLFGLACCGIELMQTGGPRADVMRFGAIPRASPRQADFMIVAGTLTYKMAERAKLLYDQMPEPKYVISMGSCSNCGGLFQLAYSVCKGVDKVDPGGRLRARLPAAARGAHRGAHPAPGDRAERALVHEAPRERRQGGGRVAARGTETDRFTLRVRERGGRGARERRLASNRIRGIE